MLLLLEVLEDAGGVEVVPEGVEDVPEGVEDIPVEVEDIPAGVEATEEDPPEDAPLKHEESVPAWTGKGADC